MKIVIPGGTGRIGTLLAREFIKQGHNVTVLSRTPRTLPWRVVLWDAEHVEKRLRRNYLQSGVSRSL
jgi:uncharacterized protein YbjT (DUF2867 family)